MAQRKKYLDNSWLIKPLTISSEAWIKSVSLDLKYLASLRLCGLEKTAKKGVIFSSDQNMLLQVCIIQKIPFLIYNL
jgi:hypothetical protein